MSQDRLSVLLDPKLVKKLEQRSEQYGLTKSQYVRFCLESSLDANITGYDDKGKVIWGPEATSKEGIDVESEDIRLEFMNAAELSLARQIAWGIHSKIQKQLRGFSSEVQKILFKYIEKMGDE